MVHVSEVEAEAREPRSWIILKIYSLIGVITFVALLSSYFFSHEIVLYGILTLLIFLALFPLQVIILSSQEEHLIPAVLLNSLGLTSFFYSALSFYLLVAFGFLALFLLLATQRGKGEMENMLKIRIGRVVRAVISYSITATVIFVIVAMVLNGTLTFTRQKVNQAVDYLVAPIARHYVKDFSPNMETGIFLSKFVETNLATNSAFKLLPPALRQESINQAVAELEKKVEGYINSEIHLRQSVGENIYQVLQLKVGGLTAEAKLYWGFLIIALILLSVKSVEFIIALPLTLIVFLVYQLLLVSGFASVDYKDRDQEVVLLSKKLHNITKI